MKLMETIQNRKAFKTSGNSSRLYLKMRSKFTLSFLVLILLPFLTLGFIISIQAIYSNLRQNNKHITTSLDYYLRDVETFVNVISSSDSLMYLYDNITTNTTSVFADMQAYNQIYSISEGLHNIKLNNVYILDNDNLHTLTSRYNYKPSKKDLYSTEWCREALKNPDKARIIGTSLQISPDGQPVYVLSVVKGIRNSKTQEFLGLLIVDFDYNAMESILSAQNTIHYNNSELIIINQDKINRYDEKQNNPIMYSSLNTNITSPAYEDLVNIVDSGSSGITVGDIEAKKNCIIVYDTSSYLPWKVVHMVPFYSIVKNTLESNSLWFLSALGCLLMILIFPLLNHAMILKPIYKLTSVISEYEKGSFPTKMNLENFNNSPEYISQTNTSSVDNLINKVYYNQLKQKEAELNSLQSKINPHFLYNTLESIRGAALYHGIDSIALMAKSLSLLFRYSINSNVLVCVKEEIDNLNNFITIQNFRHENKFEIVYNIPQKLYEYKILKLTLQPLVENCIKHGLEMKLGKGTIRITMLDLGSIIKIEISDDGIGITQEKVDELNKALHEGLKINPDNSTTGGTGIGLQNVDSRIKLYFGNQYGIKFRYSQVGTTVEVMLPVVE